MYFNTQHNHLISCIWTNKHNRNTLLSILLYIYRCISAAYISLCMCVCVLLQLRLCFSLMRSGVLSSCAEIRHSLGSDCRAGCWPPLTPSAGAPLWPIWVYVALHPLRLTRLGGGGGCCPRTLKEVQSGEQGWLVAGSWRWRWGLK